MALPYESRADGTVAFLPHRLNRQPVVVRGLTADELWICTGLSAAAGLLVGIPLALLLSTIALVPTLVVVGIALGVFVGGAVMRRQKRNRPETWLYRQVQWWVSRQLPAMAPWAGRRWSCTVAGGRAHEPLQERDHPPASAYPHAAAA